MLLVLICFPIAAEADRSDAVFERIKHSLPERDISWQIIEADEPDKQINGSIQASFVWANGAEEVRATVISHRSLKAAKAQFKRSHKDGPSVESFRADDIGDEAYLFPPIILNQDGPFNLRFRKGQYEIFMSADSKGTINRCAKYIVDAISPPTRRMQTDAAGLRR